MAVISFKTLNNNVQDAISTGKFPEKKLRELSANLKASQKKVFKFTIIIVAIMAVFIGGLFGYMIYNSLEMQQHLLGWILGYLGIVAIIFLGSYFTQIGITRSCSQRLKEWMDIPERHEEIRLIFQIHAGEKYRFEYQSSQ